MAIEMKTPAGTGVVSDNQHLFLNRLEEAGYYALISNDYDEILMTIVGYFANKEQHTCKQCASNTNQPTIARCASEIFRRVFS